MVWSPDDKDIDFFSRFKGKRGNTVAQLQFRELLLPILVELPCCLDGHNLSPTAAAPVRAATRRKKRERKRRGEGIGFLSPLPSLSSALGPWGPFFLPQNWLGSIAYLGYAISLLFLSLFMRALPCSA
jgi:hypothetical protein